MKIFPFLFAPSKFYNQYLIPIFGLLLLTACKNSELAKANRFDNLPNDVTVIRLDPSMNADGDLSMHASKLVDSLNYYPLESPDSIIIGKVTRLIQKHGLIYIYDQMSNAIFVFTQKGKFVSSIEKQGKGIGEYAKIDLFSIGADSSVSIVSYMNRSILRYDYLGKFISSRKLNPLATDISILSDNSVMFYNAKFSNEGQFSNGRPLQDRLFKGGNKGVTASDLPFEYVDELVSYPLSSRCFFNFNDSLTLMEPLTNFIYRVDTERTKAKLRYAVDFAKENGVIDYSMSQKNIRKALRNLDEEKTSAVNLFSFNETKDAIIFLFGYEGYMMKGLYSKHSKNVKYLSTVWINDIDHISMPSIEATTENGSYLGIIDAQTFRQMVSTNKNELPLRIKTLYKNLKDTDNPILVEFSLKDF